VLGRLGFAGRMMAIVLLALFGLRAVATGWAYVSGTNDDLRLDQLPLPAQAAAIVQMIERAEPSWRDLILQGVTSDSLRVTVVPERPIPDPEARRMRGVEWILHRYGETLGTRDVSVTSAAAFLPSWRMIGWWRLPQNLSIAVSLNTGGFVLFEAKGDLSRRLFGLPPGFWVGALGSLVAIAALLAVYREARPLRDLARAVSGFTGSALPQPVRARGAPEIRKLIAAVNEMQGRIAALVKGRTVLLGAISHDLKTYITRLRLRVEAVPSDVQREKAVRDLDDMTVLIDDALAVARGGTVSDRRESVDLTEIVEDIVADSPRDRVTARLGARARALVSGDPVALRRLIGNLVDNALQHARNCTIELQHAERSIILHVDDDGPGIPEAERVAIFEPFYRLEHSRSRTTGGSGLGLTIAKQIAENHGGSISIASSLQNGARVAIELPIVPSPVG
jgi:two-component system, OmpR family, osmolarity sensor histidine kinase EnvZ